MATRSRIKEKYNPTPTAREKAFHIWLIQEFPCACGCGWTSTVVHHPLQRHPAQRWRRDHEYVVPMNGFCHMRLHRAGSEEAFIPGLDFATAAYGFRKIGIEQGKLNG
jgi:hypothetical protein